MRQRSTDLVFSDLVEVSEELGPNSGMLQPLPQPSSCNHSIPGKVGRVKGEINFLIDLLGCRRMRAGWIESLEITMCVFVGSA